jgi:diguanylate cyclase (GGDEF)-like protein
MRPAIKERLEKCSSLPTLPAVAVEVLRLCQSDELNLGDIARVIANDPALSAKVLRLVNSPVYALRQPVKTVAHALALLGVNAVRTLALSFSLVRDLRKGQGVGLNLQAYWKRSILAAVGARELAAVLGMGAAKDEAFLAGLLQDLGRLALVRTVPDIYNSICAQVPDEDHRRLAALETEALGCDHAAVGQWLAGRWNLPEPLCLAVGFSHQPDALPAAINHEVAQLVRTVGVGALLADVWTDPSPAEATRTLRQEAARLLRLTPAQLEPVLTRMADAMPELSALFDIDLGTADEIGGILDQANEALVLVTLRASRQFDTARLEIATIEAKAKAMEEESQHDALTGLYNRARFDAVLTREFEQSARSGKPLTVIMADVDHFKKVNDTYGHPAGDKVLVAVATSVGGRLRPRDLAARFGGEEFVLVLPETDAAGALVVAERVRSRVEEAVHQVGPGVSLRITISLGCVTLGPSASAGGYPVAFASKEALLEAADQALYAAKRGGRNRVVAHDPAARERVTLARS